MDSTQTIIRRNGNHSDYGGHHPNRRKSRKRQRSCSSSTKSRTNSHSLYLLYYSAVLLVLMSTSLTTAHTYSQCYRHLYDANGAANGDTVLQNEEFANAVQRITYSAISVPNFASLSTDLRLFLGANNINLSLQGLSPSAAPIPVIDEFCFKLYEALIEEFEVPYSLGTCQVQMSLADRGADGTNAIDFRLQKQINQEFATFANKMTTDSLYGNSPTFQSLPEPVRLVYGDFEESSAQQFIDITGALPFSQADDAQKKRLESLCRQITVAIQAGIAVAGPPPTPAPVQDTGCSTDYTTSECLSRMVLADLNPSNNILSQEEFVRFIELLADCDKKQFKFLPTTVQTLYGNKAAADGTNGVSILGARYNDRTISRTEVLDEFCEDLRQALIDGAGETAPPTPAPTAVPPLECNPIPFDSCTLAMATSELGTRNDSLDQEEYVIFINKATGFEFFEEFSFEQLGPDLIANYVALATLPNGEIPITGSVPGLPTINRTPEQTENLRSICDSTNAALEITLCPSNGGGTEPTISPAPTTESGSAIVYNAFVISNDQDLTADELSAGEEYDGINQGYINLISDVVIGEDNRRMLSRPSLRLLPATGIADESTEVYEIANTDCPSSVNTTIGTVVCHVAYGRFNVSYAGESNETEFVESITNLTQEALIREQNGLQSYIFAAFPNTSITVVGLPEDGFLRPEEPAPAPGPPVQPRSGGSGDGGNGAIIGIVIAVVVVALLVGGYLYYRHRNGQDLCCFEFSMPSFGGGRGQKKQRNNTEDDFEDEYGKDPEMAVDSDRNNGMPPRTPSGSKGFNLPGGITLPIPTLGNRDKPSGDEEESNGFSVQEQESSGDSKSPEDYRYGAGGNGRNSATERNEVPNNTSNVFGSFGLGRSRRGSLGMMQITRNKPPHGGRGGPEDERSHSGNGESIQDMSRVGDYGFDVQGNNSFLGTAQSEASQSENLEEGDWNPQSSNTGNAWGTSAWGQRNDARESDEFSEEEEEESSDYEDDDDGETFEDKANSEEESSEDDTYQEGDNDTKTMGSSHVGMKQFNSMVESGDWDGVIEEADDYDNNDDVDSYVPRRASVGTFESTPMDPNSESEESSEQDESEETSTSHTSGSPRSSEVSGSMSGRSLTSEELRNRQKYLKKVEELVKKVVPDEADNVATMMDQFAGREEELINTLETMYERSYSVRARKAMHKSKAIPDSSDRDPTRGRFGMGGAEGAAAAAAASTIGVGFERPMEDFDDDDTPQTRGGFGGDNAGFGGGGYGDEDEESESGSGSYEDDDQEDDYDDDGDEDGEYNISSFGEDIPSHDDDVDIDGSSYESEESSSYEDDEVTEDDVDIDYGSQSQSQSASERFGSNVGSGFDYEDDDEEEDDYTSGDSSYEED